MAVTLADGNLKHIFLNENVRISIKITLKFVPMVPYDNKSALYRSEIYDKLSCERFGIRDRW